MDNLLIALGTLFSGIASMAIIGFTISIYMIEKNKKRAFANYYLKRVRKRMTRVLEAIEKNCKDDNSVHLSIHQTPRGFDDISKNGLDYSINPEQEEAIEEFMNKYNDYLYAYWINSENNFVTPVKDEDKIEINKGSRAYHALLEKIKKQV